MDHHHCGTISTGRPRPSPPQRLGRIRKRYVILLLFALLLGWLGWMIAGAMSARPGPLVDYGRQLLDLSAAAQPEGENGWPALLDAIAIYDSIDPSDLPDWPTDLVEAAEIESLTRILDGEFDGQRLRFELALLERIEASGALERLDAMSAAPRAVRESIGLDGPGIVFTLLPELSPARSLAKMCAARMRVALERGDSEQFLRSAEHGLALGRVMAHDPFYISRLVGLAVSNLAFSEIGHALVERELDEPTCLRLLALLDRHVLPPMSLALEAERLCQLDAIQRLYSDDGKGDGILLMSKSVEMGNMLGGGPPVGGGHPVMNVAGLFLPGRAETTRLLDEYFDAAIEQSVLTGPQQQAHPVDLETFVDNLPRGHFFLKMLLPALSRGGGADRKARAVREALRLTLAIEAFEARHGRPPEALADLAPEFLPSIPIDPVSGQAFVLARREATAADPREWLLYSIGADGQDNGGAETPDPDDAYDALDVETGAQGFDYVFNRLRPPAEEPNEPAESPAESPATVPVEPAPAAGSDEGGR